MDNHGLISGRKGAARKLLGAISPTRLAGIALHNAWVLACFHNDFMFLSAADLRGTMYLCLPVSLLALVATLLAAPKFLPRPDKTVLSRRCIHFSGAAVMVSTALICLADCSDPLGTAVTVAAGLGTGVGSGLLFLGWGRLYSDVGTRPALVEMLVSLLLACALMILFIYTNPVVASIFVVAGAGASALLLRKSVLQRPTRPKPSRDHRLHSRTKRMFARGICACLCIGAVQGLADVLSGFKYFDVPASHPTFLMLGCAAVTLLLLVATLVVRHDFVSYIYRLVTMALVLGCLITSAPDISPTASGMIVLGSYQGFIILVCVVCIDISNYFNVRATTAFGIAFGALYLGEAVGVSAGQLLAATVPANSLSLTVVCIVLTMFVVLTNLFLFTEKDLVETSLGEMIDEEPEVAAAAAASPDDARQANAAATAPAHEDRVAAVCAYLARKYQLTPREQDVLPLIVKGRTIARIQEELYISQGTVSTHMRHIYQKTGSVNRQGLLDLIDSIPDSEL